jgi:uncharacterized protein YwqG
MSLENRAHELFESGKACMESGDFDLALKHLSMSLSYAGLTEAYLLKAQVQLMKDNLKDALFETERGIAACLASEEPELKAELSALKVSLEEEIARREQVKKAQKDAIRQARYGAINYEQAKVFAKHHLLPSVRMHLVVPKKGVKGNSQLGGRPRIPKGFQWPKRNDGTPLHFLCQVDLAELTKFSSARQNLPAEGMLSFFYESGEQPWGLTKAEKDGWRVYYFRQSKDLEEYEEEIDLLPMFKIRFTEEPTYPDALSDEVESLAADAHDEYTDFSLECYGDRPFHRLLGHPQLVQTDLRQPLEIAAKDVDIDNAMSDIEKATHLFKASRRWKLLLQIDTDENAGMMWGDGGTLYFLIEDEALKKKNFDNVWLQLQCF